jgi:hypothetical protein
MVWINRPTGLQERCRCWFVICSVDPSSLNSNHVLPTDCNSYRIFGSLVRPHAYLPTTGEEKKQNNLIDYFVNLPRII